MSEVALTEKRARIFQPYQTVAGRRNSPVRLRKNEQLLLVRGKIGFALVAEG